MKKSVPLTIAIILLVSLGIFSAFQVKKLSNTKTHLSEQLANIQELEQTLATEQEDKNFLTDLNVELQEENQTLRDSIDKLHRVLRKLRKKVRRQDDVIADLQQKINHLENNYANLKQEIAILSRKDVVDKEKIQELETQKAEVKTQLVTYETQKQETLVSKDLTQNEIIDKENSEERFRRIVDIVNNTRVKFQHILLKKSEIGRPVSRLISDGKNWKYTDIEFYLEHDNVKQLLDKHFMLKIIDTDNQRDLSVIESNPMFPTSKGDNRGISFLFDGNLVELVHFNNQPKKGTNYEVQVFFMSSDGEEYLLLDGVKQFVRDGNIIGF